MSRDAAIIERFKQDPEGAYAELLEHYSPILLRMIRRFMKDPDDVMEVYTSIAERLRANNFQALRRFRINSELTPWLSVVVANACRDRFRKQRMVSAPQSVISQLDEKEKLVFKYYYQDNLPYEDIAELISGKHDIPCTRLDVKHAIEKINDLLTVNKRWHLLTALNMNRTFLSIEDLREAGFQPSSDSYGSLEAGLGEREQINQLNAAIAKLDDEDQLLVLLRYEHGMRAQQIARVMRYENHKYVYTRLRTIVNRLRREMTNA
ncbi:sigma factor [Rhodocaloribacter sp.]